MGQVHLPNSVQRILKVANIFMFISLVAVLAMGIALSRVNDDVKHLEGFLEEAAHIQPNFQKSLLIYTENTKDAINYLLSLRPATEKELVAFIGAIESLGVELGLDLEIQAAATENDYIIYAVEFLGSDQDVIDFLRGVEALDYFVGMTEVRFRSLKLLALDSEGEKQNVQIWLKLFRK